MWLVDTSATGDSGMRREYCLAIVSGLSRFLFLYIMTSPVLTVRDALVLLLQMHIPVMSRTNL